MSFGTRHWFSCCLLSVLLACSSSDGDKNAADSGAGDGDTAAPGDGDVGDGDTTGDGDTAGDGDMAGDGDTAGDGDMAGDGDASGDDDAGIPLGSVGDWTIPDELLLCGDQPCECANGIDDDGDGTVDGFDSECTGPNDNDEGSFATGIPGDNKDNAHQDCFFDGDSGHGNDGCMYEPECLTGDLPQTDPACQVSQQCIDFCKPRTPNGCDCFGCCTFTTVSGTSLDVFIGSGGDCSEENLDACTMCKKNVDACNNECGECELCPGKSLDDLPASCFMTPGDGDGDSSSGDGDIGTGDGDTGTGDGDTTAPPPFVCDGGATACWATSDCEPGFYCGQGCCLLIPPG